jgi:tetratricopeptide (TPR) repeat protein/class 3 adenylate cyclase
MSPDQNSDHDADLTGDGGVPEGHPGTGSTLEIAHILFMDLVGYSRLPMEQQTGFIHELQAVVRGTHEFERAQNEERLVVVPTGDGMVLVFFGDPTAPATCALEIAAALNDRPHLKLRMGVHSGPVYRVSDINAQQNVAGAGINMAQRVMDCGGAGHILLSRTVADVLSQFSRWSDALHDIGDYEVKHGVTLRIFNLYTQTLGNKTTPAGGRKHSAMRRKAGLWWAVAGAIASLLAIGGWYQSYRAAPKQKLVAVLPFRNVGGEPGNQPFCDGLMETVSSKLTEMQQFKDSLSIVPSSELSRASLTTADQARRAFGVNMAVTGSVQRTGEHIRLTINLVDAASLRQLQAITIDAPAEDPAALQDGVVSGCARMLDIELHPQARTLLAAGRTASPRAYDFYLQAQGYLQQFGNPASLDQAIALFRKSLEQDPYYAAAYENLGKAYWRKYQDTRDKQWMDEARRNCDRALQLDDRIPSAHVNLGEILADTGKPEQAVDEFRKALDLDPVNADAFRGLAATYEAMNKEVEAETVYKHAIELRPDQWSAYSRLGVFYYRRGRYHEAEPMFRRVIDLVPGNDAGPRLLGGLYLAMGRYTEAAKLLEKAVSARPSAGVYNNLALVYYFQKRYQDAANLMAKAIALRPDDYLNWSTLADIYSAMPAAGEKARTTYLKAIELARHELAVNPRDGGVLSDVAVYHAKTSNKKDALDEIEKSLQLAPDDKDVLQNSIIVYEMTGHRERALRAVGTAVKRGYPVEEVQRQPGLAELRKDPEYQRMISEGFGRPADAHN